MDPECVLEEEDEGFDMANAFELYNPDGILVYDGDRHAIKWTSYELKKATLIDKEVLVGAGTMKIT